MIRTSLHLIARNSGVGAVLDFYEQRKIVERSLSQPGCLHVDVGLLLPERGVVVVTAVWESEAAYAQWAANPSRAHDVDDLVLLLDAPIAPASVVDVVSAADRDAATPSPRDIPASTRSAGAR